MSERSTQMAPDFTPRRRGRHWPQRSRFVAALLAMIFALAAVSAQPAWAADTDGGPGIWGPAAPGGAPAGSRAALYEAQINGRGSDQNYWVPYPQTRARPGFDINTWEPWTEPIGQARSGVAFDGWNRAAGELLDAKGEAYARLLDPRTKFSEVISSKLVGDADRQ